jgi:CheY-like chemotaxis protein
MSEAKTDTRFTVRSKRPIRPVSWAKGPILIVDDNLDDAKLTERVFLQLNSTLPITVFSSGRDLVAHLKKHGKGESSNADSGAAAKFAPSAILLDLGMPEMDGFSVLEWCAKEPEFASIPVIVLTNFNDLPHMKQAYALGARSYLLKPIDQNALRSVLSSLSISV